MQRLHELEAFVDPAHNFEVYRRHLKSLGGQLPIIPLMSLFLKDLTFINEIPKRLNSGLYNFFKLRQVRVKIAQFQHYQRSEYTTFVEIPKLIAYLRNIPAYDETQLYELSYKIDPRRADTSSGAHAGAPAAQSPPALVVDPPEASGSAAGGTADAQDAASDGDASETNGTGAAVGEHA